MMGRSHALSGLDLGIAAATVSPMPGPVTAVCALLIGGGALVPDLDEPNSTIARSLGFVTWLLAKGVDKVALTVYHSTRGPRDPAKRSSGHRLITHTPVGSAVFGLIAGVPAVLWPWGAFGTCFMVCGLLTCVFRREVRILGRQITPKSLAGLRPHLGLILAGVSGWAGYWVSEQYPAWSWTFGVSVFVGCLIHREGDWCTNSGVPRRLWPRMIDGRRWDRTKCPWGTFETGGDTEQFVTFRLLLIGFVVSVGCTLGVVQPIVHYAWTSIVAAG